MEPTLLNRVLVILLLQYCRAQPNFVVIVADDVGYGDLHCYGHPSQERGAIDELAKEGMKFQNWYSGAASSSASRAALMTGKYPVRLGFYGDALEFGPTDSGGLPLTETTIAKALAEVGYSTGMAGKWHLGINRDTSDDGKYLPHNHGFQNVGTLYPIGQVWKCNRDEFSVDEMKSTCFKYQEATIAQQPFYPENSTASLISYATEFISSQSSEQPFFLYLSFLQAHDSLFCSERFCGNSQRGSYGDSINELNWAVGEVMSTLESSNIDQETAVIFLSANGPNKDMCTLGGSSGILSGGKPTTYEGGIRVPAVIRWPGMVTPGKISYEAVSTLDIFPTLLNLSGHDISDYELDGLSIAGVLTNGERSPHEILYHYCANRLMAVTMNNLKFHFYGKNLTKDYMGLCVNGRPTMSVELLSDHCFGEDVIKYDPPLIYDINKDPAEKFPLDSAKYSDTLANVNDIVQKHISSIETVDPQIGNYNDDLQPCCNPPNCVCNYPGSAISFNVSFRCVLWGLLCSLLVHT